MVWRDSPFQISDKCGRLVKRLQKPFKGEESRVFQLLNISELQDLVLLQMVGYALVICA